MVTNSFLAGLSALGYSLFGTWPLRLLGGQLLPDQMRK
jgi:hypothetical protein